MLAELNRLAEVGAAVHARQKSLNDVPCAQIEPSDSFDRFRIQEFLRVAHR